MQKKLVVGNLKMNPVSAIEFERYLDMLEKEIKSKDFERTEIVICPPVIFLQKLLDRKIKNVKAGVQDVFWEYQGAFTGQISAGMVKSSGAEFAIVGHSERRKYFGENEEIINLKLKAILKNGLQRDFVHRRKRGRTKKGPDFSNIEKAIERFARRNSAGKIGIYQSSLMSRSGRWGRTKFRLRTKFWKRKLSSKKHSRKYFQERARKKSVCFMADQ